MREFRIGLENARKKMEAGEAVVLDVTSPLMEPAVRGRIPGAIRVSPRELLDTNRPTAEVLRRLPPLPRDKTIVVYCT